MDPTAALFGGASLLLTVALGARKYATPPLVGVDACGASHEALAVLRSHPALGLPIRRHFALAWGGGAIHLNHGSYGTAPRPVTAAARAVEDAVEASPDGFFRRWGKGAYGAACDAAAGLVRSSPPHTALVPNATFAVNAVLRSLRLKPGDRVLINEHTYGACRNAVVDTAERAGAVVVTLALPLPECTAPGAILRAVRAELATGPFAFALFDHITSPTAIVMPIRDIVLACNAAGVPVMVDGAHAPGQIAGLDVGAIGADWYCGNLHKWAFCPKGVCVLALHPTSPISSTTQGAIISHFWLGSFRERCWMQGTMDLSPFLAVPAALDFVAAQLGGWGEVHAYNAALARAGAEVCSTAWGTEQLLPPELCAPFLIPVRAPLSALAWLPKGHPAVASAARGDLVVTDELARECVSRINEAVAGELWQHNRIQSQTFCWVVGGEPTIYVRLSAQVYNTLDEYKALAAAVVALKEREKLVGSAER